MGDPLRFLGGIAATLPGDYQTPARACLFLVLLLLKFTYGELDIRLDCKLVLDGLTWKDRMRRPQGGHSDLWKVAGRALDQRAGRLVVHKVKAHCTEADFVNGEIENDVDFAGNHYADRLAAAAAELHCLPLDVTQGIRCLRGRQSLILQRLIATNAFVLDNSAKRVKSERSPRDPLAQTGLQKKVVASGHSFACATRFVSLLPSSLRCRTCQQLVQKRHLKKFLNDRCPGPPAQVASARGFARPRRLRVRRADLRASHAVLLYRGLWFCTKCAAYTSGANAIGTVRNLCKPCRPGSRGGKVCLRRIARGRHPALKQWPDEATPHADASPASTRPEVPEAESRACALVPCVRLRSKTTLELDQLVLTEPRELLPLLAQPQGLLEETQPRPKRLCLGLDDSDGDDAWDAPEEAQPRPKRFCPGLDDSDIDDAWEYEDDPGVAQSSF